MSRKAPVATPELEAVALALRKLAASEKRDYCALVVKADGRVAVELFGPHTHRTLERYHFSETDKLIGEPLFSFPRGE